MGETFENMHKENGPKDKKWADKTGPSNDRIIRENEQVNRTESLDGTSRVKKRLDETL